ncbi:hypothetical protein BGW41_002129 [Actinomortierella wolfii]|nr:hypothetical protein BGW41_002129 [Actinomortierella wolfii]
MEYLLPLWLRQYWLERQRREIPSEIAAHLLQKCAEALSSRDPSTLEALHTRNIQQSFNTILETQQQRTAAERSARAGRFPFYKASSSAPSPSKLTGSSSPFTTPAALLGIEASDFGQLNPQEIIRLVIYIVKKSHLDYVDPETCELVHLQGEALEHPHGRGDQAALDFAGFDVVQSVLYSSQYSLNNHTKALLLVALFCARRLASSGPTTPSARSPAMESSQEHITTSASTSPRPQVSHRSTTTSPTANKWIARLGQAIFGFPCAHAGHAHHRRTRGSIELMERQRAELDRQLLRQQQLQRHRQEERRTDGNGNGSGSERAEENNPVVNAPTSPPTTPFSAITSDSPPSTALSPSYSIVATPLSTSTTTTVPTEAATPRNVASPRVSDKWCRHCSRAIYQVLAEAEQYKERWLQDLQQDSEIGLEGTGRDSNIVGFELLPVNTAAAARTPFGKEKSISKSRGLSSFIALPSPKAQFRHGPIDSDDSDAELSPPLSDSCNPSLASSVEIVRGPPKTIPLSSSTPSPARSPPGGFRRHLSTINRRSSGSSSSSLSRLSNAIAHSRMSPRPKLEREESFELQESPKQQPMTRLERDLAEAVADSTPRWPFLSSTARTAEQQQRGRQPMDNSSNRSIERQGSDDGFAAKDNRTRLVDPLSQSELDQSQDIGSDVRGHTKGYKQVKGKDEKEEGEVRPTTGRSRTEDEESENKRLSTYDADVKDQPLNDDEEISPPSEIEEQVVHKELEAENVIDESGLRTATTEDDIDPDPDQQGDDLVGEPPSEPLPRRPSNPFLVIGLHDQTFTDPYAVSLQEAIEAVVPEPGPLELSIQEGQEEEVQRPRGPDTDQGQENDLEDEGDHLEKSREVEVSHKTSDGGCLESTMGSVMGEREESVDVDFQTGPGEPSSEEPVKLKTPEETVKSPVTTNSDDRHGSQHRNEDQTNQWEAQPQQQDFDRQRSMGQYSASSLLSASEEALESGSGEANDETYHSEDDIDGDDDDDDDDSQDNQLTPEDELTEQQLLERRQRSQDSVRRRRKRLVDDARRKQEQLERIKARLELRSLGKIRPIVSFWEEKSVLEQKNIGVEEVEDEREETTPGPAAFVE